MGCAVVYRVGTKDRGVSEGLVRSNMGSSYNLLRRS